MVCRPWPRRKDAGTPEDDGAAPPAATGRASAMYEALSELGVGPLNAEQRQMVIAPANARAVFSDHPAVGLGARTDATADAGSARVTSFGFAPSVSPDLARVDGPETAEALPVLLLEPRHAFHWHAPGYGQVEAQVQAMCRGGFSLWTSALMALVRVPGWTLSRTSPELLELHGPGGRWAHTTLTPDPQWVAAATSQHVVLVVYGPAIGVRSDDANSEYPDSSRKAELDEFREIGYVSAGIVAFDH